MLRHAADMQRLDLTRFSLSSAIQLGKELRTLHINANSMEDVADRVVRLLRERFVDQQGELTNVLVRFYRTMFLADLDERLRVIATRGLKDVAPDSDTRCLALLATAGSKREWNARTESRTHQCIPLLSSKQVAEMPMIAQLLRQLGMDLATFDAGSAGMLRDLDQHHLHNVFYVPEAEGSPCIPDQEGFVVPNGIRSVIGFGGALPGRQVFAVIAFARAYISREMAALFGLLSVSARLAVMQFHRPEETFRIASSLPPAVAHDPEFLRSKIGSLEQLLDVYEETVQAQARQMELGQAELRPQ